MILPLLISLSIISINFCDTSFGLCPAPMEAQQALDILVSYLLGDDWHTTLPVSVEQCNAIATEQILDKYSTKWRKDWKNYEKTALDAV